jgi:hypothetical protein
VLELAYNINYQTVKEQQNTPNWRPLKITTALKVACCFICCCMPVLSFQVRWRSHTLQASLALLIFATFGIAQTSLALRSFIAKSWSCGWLFV